MVWYGVRDHARQEDSASLSRIHGRVPGPVLPRNQPLSADRPRRRGTAGQGNPSRGRGGARQACALQSALRGFGVQEVPEPGCAAPRSNQRGESRPDPGRAPLRRDQGYPLCDLRRVVDPPGDPSGTGRAESHRQGALESCGGDSPHRPMQGHTGPGTRPRAHGKRNRGKGGPWRGRGRADRGDREFPPVSGCTRFSRRGSMPPGQPARPPLSGP